MCESNTAAQLKSNGKDTILTLNGTAWERHGVCELALSVLHAIFPYLYVHLGFWFTVIPSVMFIRMSFRWLIHKWYNSAVYVN
jgi:hypothetical protein